MRELWELFQCNLELRQQLGFLLSELAKVPTTLDHLWLATCVKGIRIFTYERCMTGSVCASANSASVDVELLHRKKLPVVLGALGVVSMQFRTKGAAAC